MSTIPVTPVVLKNCLVQIGADQFERHLSTVEFVPSASSTTWKGLSPEASFTDVTTATWTVNLAFAQDWANEFSLSNYLFENEGDTVLMVFQPVNGGQGFAAQVVITPGAIGGAVDSTAVATVALGVQGRPYKT